MRMALALSRLPMMADGGKAVTAIRLIVKAHYVLVAVKAILIVELIISRKAKLMLKKTEDIIFLVIH